MTHDSNSGLPHSVHLDWRVNVVSLANLIALVGVLFTAISTWYGLVYKVEDTKKDIDIIRQSIIQILAEKKASETRVEQINSRLYGIETKVEVQKQSLDAQSEALKDIQNRLEVLR